MTPEERKTLIAQYRAGYDEVIDSLKDFPVDLMTAHPIPAKWSAREIVHHLADSETISGLRLRKLLSEDAPVIQGYDQDDYAIRFKYNEREIDAALEALHAARVNSAQILDQIS